MFLSATEYHSDADYNLRRVGVVVVVVVVDHNFNKAGYTAIQSRTVWQEQ